MLTSLQKTTRVRSPAPEKKKRKKKNNKGNNNKNQTKCQNKQDSQGYIVSKKQIKMTKPK